MKEGTRRLQVARLLLVVAISLLLAGCGDKKSDAQGTPADVATPTSPPPEPDPGSGADTGAGTSTLTIPSQPEPSAPTLGDVAQENADRAAREGKVLSDAQALGPLLNDFWTRELSARYGLAFDTPDRYEYYRGDQPTSCGDFTGARGNNAFYCFTDTDEHVAFDLDWLQQYLVNHPGGATTFLILAHEWGHAVQDTWLENGGTDTWDPANRQELNADCLAGVFLAASIREGTVVEQAGDAEAIFGWLAESGSSPWIEPGTHGTSQERQTAFSDGYSNGTDYCRTTY